jgi:hypothetical protein
VNQVSEVKVTLLTMALVTWWILLAAGIAWLFKFDIEGTYTTVVASGVAQHLVRQFLAKSRSE